MCFVFLMLVFHPIFSENEKISKSLYFNCLLDLWVARPLILFSWVLAGVTHLFDSSSGTRCSWFCLAVERPSILGPRGRVENAWRAWPFICSFCCTSAGHLCFAGCLPASCLYSPWLFTSGTYIPSSTFCEKPEYNFISWVHLFWSKLSRDNSKFLVPEASSLVFPSLFRNVCAHVCVCVSFSVLNWGGRQ